MTTTVAFPKARSALAAILAGGLGASAVVTSMILISPLMALAASLGLIVAIAMLVFPALGLTLTAFVVPIERFGRFGDDYSLQLFSLMRIVGSIALVGVMIHMILRRWRPVVSSPTILYSLYCGLSVLSLFWAEDPIATRHQIAASLGNLLCLFLFANGARDWEMVKRITLTWLVVTILICCYQVYDWHFGSAEQEFESHNVIKNPFSTTWDSKTEAESVGTVRRAMGTTSNAAVYGVNLIMTIPFFIYFAKLAPDLLWRSLALGGLMLVLYNLLLTNTRAVLILSLISFSLCAVTRLVRISFAKLAAAAAVCAALVVATPEHVWRRIFDPSNYTVDRAANLRRRLEMWEAVLQMADQYWLTGVGVGNRTSLLRFMEPTHVDIEVTAPHNVMLQAILELGIPGLVLLAVFLVATIILIQRAMALYRADPARQDRYLFLVACQISVVTTIVFGIQVDVFHFPLKGWWMIVGLASALHAMALRRDGLGYAVMR